MVAFIQFAIIPVLDTMRDFLLKPICFGCSVLRAGMAFSDTAPAGEAGVCTVQVLHSASGLGGHRVKRQRGLCLPAVWGQSADPDALASSCPGSLFI